MGYTRYHLVNKAGPGIFDLYPCAEMATRQARRDEASGHTDSPCQTVTSACLVHLMFDSLTSSFVRASDMAPCLAS